MHIRRPLLTLAACVAALLAMPTGASAAPSSCTVDGAGRATLTLDGTGVTLFFIDFQPGTTGAFEVNATPFGVTNPCAGFDRSTATELTIVGSANNEAIQLYTDRLPDAGLPTDIDLGGGTDGISLLVDQLETTSNSQAIGANGVDLEVLPTIADGSDVDVSWNDATTEGLVVRNYDGDDRMDLSGPGLLGGPIPNLMVAGGEGDDTIYGGTGANNLVLGDNNSTSGSGDDTFYDGGGSTAVQMGQGDDTIVVGASVDAGDDYEGNAGTDTLDFSARSGGVDVSFGNDVNDDGANAGAEADDIDEFELVTGSSGDDELDASGNAAAVQLTGGDGDDVLTGSASSDTYVAGAADDGADTIVDAGGSADHLTYAARTGSVNATIDGTADDGAMGEGDSIPTAIEFVTGGSGGDSFIGTGTGGATFDGNGGTDTYVGYVDGANGTLTDSAFAEEGSDTLLNVEEAAISILDVGGTIDASAFTGPVAVTGSTGADTITTGSGWDTIDAGAGVDSITTGNGTDTITSGAGSDTVDAGGGPDVLDEFGDGHASITATASQVTWSGGDVDAITGVERLRLIGDGASSTIDVSAFPGTAEVDGGSGDDRIVLGGGTQSITAAGSGGTDTIAITSDAATTTLTDTTLVANGSHTISGFEVADLAGGPSSNTLDASAFTGRARLDGREGSDTLRGTTGDDQLFGGPGTDTLPIAVSGNVTIGAATVTAAGVDSITDIEAATITDAAGAQLIDASAFTGTATLVASGSGAITLTDTALVLGGVTDTIAGIDAATITGSSGDDTFTPAGFSGAYTVDAGAGTDRLDVTCTGDVTLTDAVATCEGVDTIAGFEAATVTAGPAAQAIDASAFSGTTSLVAAVSGTVTLGPTSLVGGGVTDTLAGIDAATLTGSDSADTIDASAFSGALVIDAGAGDDTVTGGAGSDTLAGGAGTDRIAVTGSGTITLTDSATTGAGTDAISGFEAATLAGGSAADTISAATFTLGSVTVSGGAGADRITGSVLGDVITGGAGNDRLVGGSGNDTITAGAGNDTVNGGAGRDRLAGNAGRDTITGGSGADRIDAGAGNDRVLARDRTRDTSISCGAGRADRASVDIARRDRTVRRCETVTRR